MNHHSTPPTLDRPMLAPPAIAKPVSMGRQPENLEWPFCKYLRSTCTVGDVEEALGSDIYTSPLVFKQVVNLGAVLTLQINRDGFSLQVTEALSSNDGRTLVVADLQVLK